jgi:hypothetical protein
MATPYSGHATIDDLHADIEIANVDVARWNGTATNLRGTGSTGAEAVVTLLEQPRPGWSAHAEAVAGADGVLHLNGAGHFHGPVLSVVAGASRSLWVRKPPIVGG